MAESDLFPATLMPDYDWWQALWPDPVEVLEKSGMHSAMDVIDLCCGDGYFTKAISSLIEPGDLYAVDLDRDLLAQAEKVVKAENGNKPEFILADACKLPEHIQVKVDMVFLANTFHGVPDKNALTVSIAKVLKSAGKFVIVNWHKRPREETVVLDKERGPDTGLRMSPAEVRAAVEPAGFSMDKIEDVGPYHYAISFIKKT